MNTAAPSKISPKPQKGLFGLGEDQRLGLRSQADLSISAAASSGIMIS